MKWTTFAAMVIVASANVADAGLFGGHGKAGYGCCEAPSCCAPVANCCPEPSCCAPAPCCEPTCCAPAPCCEPSCCAPEACCDNCCDSCCDSCHGYCSGHRGGLFHRLKCRWNARRAKRHCNSCAPSCCAPSCCAPTCAAPCGDGCTY